MDEELRVRIRNDISRYWWELFVMMPSMKDQKMYVGQPLTMEAQEQNLPASPCARLSEAAVQQLMDDLWVNGVRPSKRLLEEVPLDHLKGEVEWNRTIIERLLPVKR